MSRPRRPFIVGIGGTVRAESMSERALVKALAAAEAAGADTRLFGGAFMATLPIYNPRNGEAHTGGEAFLAAVSQCDGLIIATPGYHGSISGLVKNALDSLEDLRDDPRPYFDGRPVGCVVVATGCQAGGSTLAALRAIVHAMRGWPTPMGAALNTGQDLFGEDGEFAEPRDAAQIALVARQVVDFARKWAAG